jgi:hypothetical protein
MSTLKLAPKPKDWFFKIASRETEIQKLYKARFNRLQILILNAPWEDKPDLIAELLELDLQMRRLA